MKNESSIAERVLARVVQVVSPLPIERQGYCLLTGALMTYKMRLGMSKENFLKLVASTWDLFDKTLTSDQPS